MASVQVGTNKIRNPEGWGRYGLIELLITPPKQRERKLLLSQGPVKTPPLS